MRKAISFTAAVAITALAAGLASAQVRRGDGIVPESSIERPQDIGVRMHTTYLVHAPEGMIRPASNPGGETPASLACVYGLVATSVSGCPVGTATEVPGGGSGVIVIVDAYHYPDAAADLSVFSSQFGLPAPNFVLQYASRGQPANGCKAGWNGEASLDIEWAHAMAPNAEIVLMEAASDSYNDLFTAVLAANAYIAAHGGKGEVSMSWGGSEIGSEVNADRYFAQPGVVYVASAGDTPGVIYPSSSVNVVSAGGTRVLRSAGNYIGQSAWNEGGGGASAYELRPSFQNGVAPEVGGHRGTPDLSFDASGSSPVAVFNSSCYGGWLEVYGTSVAAPSLAGIINSAGAFHANSRTENAAIYSNMNNSNDFIHIVSGNCGTHDASTGYDLCTGVGVPKGLSGK
ncbi:MAG: S53 family peptidase [Candidatus Sulfotelmatobacter sp.]